MARTGSVKILSVLVVGVWLLTASGCANTMRVGDDHFRFGYFSPARSLAKTLESKAPARPAACGYWAAIWHDHDRILTNFPDYTDRAAFSSLPGSDYDLTASVFPFEQWTRAKWIQACYECDEDQPCSPPLEVCKVLPDDVRRRERGGRICVAAADEEPNNAGTQQRGPAGDEDCKNVAFCKYRNCVNDAETGRCAVVVNDEICKKSNNCVADGNCRFDPNYHKCVPGPGDGCRKSAACEVYGRCTYKQEGYGSQGLWETSGVCVRVKDEDCKKTAWCKEQGLCRLQDGMCVAAKAKSNGQCSFEGETGVACELKLCAKIASKVRLMEATARCCWEEPCSEWQSDFSQAMHAINSYAGVLKQRSDIRGYQALIADLKKCETPRWFRGCSN